MSIKEIMELYHSKDTYEKARISGREFYIGGWHSYTEEEKRERRAKALEELAKKSDREILYFLLGIQENK